MSWRPARTLTELSVASVAVTLCAWSWAVDDRWFLRAWSLDSRKPWLAGAIRVAVAGVGFVLVLLVRPRAGAWASRVGGREVLSACTRVLVAVGLALVISEVVLRATDTPFKHDFEHQCDTRMGEPDSRYGWVWRASQSVTSRVGGRDVTFAFDADHDRAPSTTFVADPALPTLLFVGESMVAGHGLAWEESLPAQVGRGMGMQVVNLGVTGYGSDQAFLRYVDALPHFPHLTAVVTLFFPGLIRRVAWVDHPRLEFAGHEPIVTPPHPGWLDDLRLVRLARDVLPYRDEATLRLTGEILRETARLASLHGARAIFVTPWLGEGWPSGEEYVIDELLVKQGLTVVNPDFRYTALPGDRHPDAASTGRLAEAVVAELRR